MPLAMTPQLTSKFCLEIYFLTHEIFCLSRPTSFLSTFRLSLALFIVSSPCKNLIKNLVKNLRKNFWVVFGSLWPFSALSGLLSCHFLCLGKKPMNYRDIIVTILFLGKNPWIIRWPCELLSSLAMVALLQSFWESCSSFACRLVYNSIY